MSSSVSAALSVQNLTGKTAADLVNLLVGPGPVVSNASLTGSINALGTFSGGNGILNNQRSSPNTFSCCGAGCPPGLCPPITCAAPPVADFNEGVILSTGSVANVRGPNTVSNITTQLGQPGDAQLESLLACGGVPNCTQDAAVLEFDITPNSSTLLFDYVFASEEYNEFIDKNFNDAFAFFVNGVNAAVLPGNIPVTIDTVNYADNACSYINNATFDDPAPAYQNPGAGIFLLDTQMDGLTVVLTAKAALTPGVPNHIKLVIADFQDQNLDSAVFLKAGSFVIASPTPTATTTATISPTHTYSPTISPSFSITQTFTITPTFTFSPTITQSFTVSPTFSFSPTVTPTPTRTPSFTYSPTATPTSTHSPTPTITPTPSITPTFTYSPTYSVTPTISPSPTITITASPTPLTLCLNLPPSSPNPSQGKGTWLPYFICAPAEVSIQVYTISGEWVRDLNVGAKFAGTHETFWDNRNGSGRQVATGVYIYRVLAEGSDGQKLSGFKKTAVIR